MSLVIFFFKHHFSWIPQVYWLFFFRERNGESKRETGREKCWFVVPLICAFIAWSLYVPWPGIQPATLTCQDNVLTDWAPWAAQDRTSFGLSFFHPCFSVSFSFVLFCFTMPRLYCGRHKLQLQVVQVTQEGTSGPMVFFRSILLTFKKYFFILWSENCILCISIF